jgi:hypothetical protein
MQQPLFWAAALACSITFAVHTFIGGARVARPLLADRSLPRASKWLSYYCWHIVTVLLAAMALGYAYAAWSGNGRDLVAAQTALSAALSILSAGVAFKADINPLRFPSTTLFAVTACLGAAGLSA